MAQPLVAYLHPSPLNEFAFAISWPLESQLAFQELGGFLRERWIFSLGGGNRLTAPRVGASNHFHRPGGWAG